MNSIAGRLGAAFRRFSETDDEAVISTSFALAIMPGLSDTEIICGAKLWCDHE